MSERHTAQGPGATRALGAAFAEALLRVVDASAAPMLVTLSGELGAGKTTFVSGLLGQLGHAGPVRSPTYTLIEPYRLAGRDVYHCDLYRLRHPDELEDLGVRDLYRPGAVILVEWPEKAEGRLGSADVTVECRYAGDAARELLYTAHTAAGSRLLGQL